MIKLFIQTIGNASSLIGRGILKSRMNREVHVRFCEEQGVKSPLLTRLYVRPSSGGFELKVCVHRSRVCPRKCWSKAGSYRGFALWVGFVRLRYVPDLVRWPSLRLVVHF